MSYEMCFSEIIVYDIAFKMISLSRKSQTMKVKAHAFEVKLITSLLGDESNIELRISAPNTGLPFKSK
jgi:hypothetical protein